MTGVILSFVLITSVIPKETTINYINEEYLDLIIQETSIYEDTIDIETIAAMIYLESRWIPDAKNGTHLGLGQITPRWHQDRMDKLEVTNLTDPKQNIKVMVDYLNELYLPDKDHTKAVLVYRYGYKDAYTKIKNNTLGNYYKEVLRIKDIIKLELEKKETKITSPKINKIKYNYITQ